MNETASKEWLIKAWHHLSTAELLSEANHYTDVIAIEIHYAAEISLKAFLAFENSKIIKTHDLIEIYKHIRHRIAFDNEALCILDNSTFAHKPQFFLRISVQHSDDGA